MKLAHVLITSLLALLVFGAASAQRALRIEGSDTMYILNQRWAEAYRERHPNANVVVRGGGSRFGVLAFSTRQADLAASSRRFLVEEIASIRGNGIEAYEVPVALDALAIAVPSTNTTPSLSLAQLKAIYLGQVRNWKEVGGPDLAIVTLSRDTNSGTHDVFRQQVLDGQEWGLGVRFVSSTAEESRELLAIPGAVAYGGIGYFANLPGVRLIPISNGGEPIPPSEDTVRNRTYPLWRYLFFYTNGRPRGEVKRFLDFIQSDEGHGVTRKTGYYPLLRSR